MRFWHLALEMATKWLKPHLLRKSNCSQVSCFKQRSKSILEVRLGTASQRQCTAEAQGDSSPGWFRCSWVISDSLQDAWHTPHKIVCGELGNCLSLKVRPGDEFPNHRSLHMSQQQSGIWAQPAQQFTLFSSISQDLTVSLLGAKSVQKMNFLYKTMHKHFHAIFCKN